MVFFILRPRETQTKNNEDVNEDPETKIIQLVQDEVNKEETKNKKVVVRTRRYFLTTEADDAFIANIKQKIKDLEEELENFLLPKLTTKEEHDANEKVKKKAKEASSSGASSNETITKQPKPEKINKPVLTIEEENELRRKIVEEKAEAERKAQNEKTLKAQEDYIKAVTQWRENMDLIDNTLQPELNSISAEIKKKEAVLETIDPTLDALGFSEDQKNQHKEKLNNELTKLKEEFDQKHKVVETLRLQPKPKNLNIGNDLKLIDETEEVYIPTNFERNNIQNIIKSEMWITKVEEFCDTIQINDASDLQKIKEEDKEKALLFMKIFFRASMSGNTKNDRFLDPLDGLRYTQASDSIKKWGNGNSTIPKRIKDKIIKFDNELVKKLYQIVSGEFETKKMQQKDYIEYFGNAIFLNDSEKKINDEISDQECLSIFTADEINDKDLNLKSNMRDIFSSAKPKINTEGDAATGPREKRKKPVSNDEDNDFYPILKDAWENLSENEKTEQKAKLYLHAALAYYFTKIGKSIDNLQKKDFSTGDGIWKKDSQPAQKYFFGELNSKDENGKNGITKIQDKNDPRLLFFAELYKKATHLDLYTDTDSTKSNARIRMSLITENIFINKKADYGTIQDIKDEFPQLKGIKFRKDDAGDAQATHVAAATNFNTREMAIRAARAKLIGL